MLKIYNNREFTNKVYNVNNVILFGAGKRIADIESFFDGTMISKKIFMIVDNNRDKQGMEIILWGKKFKICSFQQLIENGIDNSLMLVTVEDYSSLLDDLLQKDELKNTEIVCFSHIVALQKEYKSINKVLPNRMRIEKVQMIPKKIHYCWFGNNPIPDKYKFCIESWHKFCPDYEIIEWNESNYDISKNKYMQNAYLKEFWGFVSDYARIDIVYNHGGIYLDTDVELIRNIDDLLYQHGFSGFEDEEKVNFGLGFGAVKGLPILKEIMEYYDKISFIDKNGELNLTPIPIYTTFILSKYGLVCNGEYQRVADMTIYPAKVLSGKCLYTMRTVIKPWTYAIHHYDGSWATESARRINARMEQDMKTYVDENVK